MSDVSPPSEHVADAPIFTDDRVREALFSFAPTSAAGLFGYRPSYNNAHALNHSHLYPLCVVQLICLRVVMHHYSYNRS